MRALVFVFAPFLLAIGAYSQDAPADGRESLAEARALLEEWVRTESIISSEDAQWKVEKRILQDIKEVTKKELSGLEVRLQSARNFLTEGETAKDSLLEHRQELDAIVKRIELRLPVVEAGLLERLKWFPEPLREKVALYVDRIPHPGNPRPKPNFLTRVQNIAVILREADEFNGRITLEKPTKEIGDGGRRVYNVLYFGLAIAYFVDEDGKAGGYGVPASGGWTWIRADDIAPVIADAVSIRENKSRARFLSLPFKLKGGQEK